MFAHYIALLYGADSNREGYLSQTLWLAVIPFRIKNDTLSTVACRSISTVCAPSSRLVSNAKWNKPIKNNTRTWRVLFI